MKKIVEAKPEEIPAVFADYEKDIIKSSLSNGLPLQYVNNKEDQTFSCYSEFILKPNYYVVDVKKVFETNEFFQNLSALENGVAPEISNKKFSLPVQAINNKKINSRQLAECYLKHASEEQLR